MQLKDCSPNDYGSLIFHDCRTSFHEISSTKGGVLYVIRDRKGKDLHLARFDPITGKFIENVWVNLDIIEMMKSIKDI